MKHRSRVVSRSFPMVRAKNQIVISEYTYTKYNFIPDHLSTSPKTLRDGENRQLSLFDDQPEVIRELDPPCKCGGLIGSETLESQTSPHHSRLTCLSCGGWVKWVKKADSQLGGGE